MIFWHTTPHRTIGHMGPKSIPALPVLVVHIYGTMCFHFPLSSDYPRLVTPQRHLDDSRVHPKSRVVIRGTPFAKLQEHLSTTSNGIGGSMRGCPVTKNIIRTVSLPTHNAQLYNTPFRRRLAALKRNLIPSSTTQAKVCCGLF